MNRKIKEKKGRKMKKKEDKEKLKQIRAKLAKQQSKYLLIFCPSGRKFQKKRAKQT